MRRRGLCVFLAGMALAATAAGCGESNEDLDRLTRAFDRVEDSTSRSRLLVKLDTQADGRVEMNVELVASGDQSEGWFQGTTKVGAGEWVPIEFILNKTEAWYRSANLQRQMPQGKKWVRSTDPELLRPTATPSAFVRMVEDAGEVENLGKDRLDGKVCTHLRATVDIQKLAGMDRGREEGATRFLEAIGGSDAKMPVDIWIGPDDLPVRLLVRLTLPRPGGGRPQTIRSDARILEYDVPPRHDPPPADQVIEESELN